MRFMFWNTHKNPEINEYLVQIVKENRIDLISLAEYTDDVEGLCNMIGKPEEYFLVDSPGCERITIVGNTRMISPSYQNSYSSFQLLKNQVLICFVHLPSKMYYEDKTRELAVKELIREIELIESQNAGISSVVCGDFNDNPYKSLCLEAGLFHGIPNGIDAKRMKRTILGKEYKMFYNPMWNYFGDYSFPPGTYYYSSNDAECSYWNMFDQVIIRPDLISMFKHEELKILYKAGVYDLIDSSKHPNVKISDHLPIVFELEV